jgi:hypothetical protein
MAEDTSNDITTFLIEIPLPDVHHLGQIRHWHGLKGAIDGGTVWVKDILQEQVERKEILGLPYVKIYYLKNNLLFLKGSLLPIKKMRSGLLWSALDRVVPVSIPPLNHNFFGISERVPVNIVPAFAENAPCAIIVSLDIARPYIETVAQVRLRNLSWIGVDKGLLIIGTPLLPLVGQSYWRVKDMLLPTGHDFELPIIYDTIQKMLDPGGSNLIIWNVDSSYYLLEKDAVMPLSISSFHLTYSEIYNGS